MRQRPGASIRRTLTIYRRVSTPDTTPLALPQGYGKRGDELVLSDIVDCSELRDNVLLRRTKRTSSLSGSPFSLVPLRAIQNAKSNPLYQKRQGMYCRGRRTGPPIWSTRRWNLISIPEMTHDKNTRAFVLWDALKRKRILWRQTRTSHGNF